jgi:hypothetical protein
MCYFLSKGGFTQLAGTPGAFKCQASVLPLVLLEGLKGTIAQYVVVL